MSVNQLTGFINNPIFIVIVIADLILKGIGLWKAARNNQRNWFIAMLIVNTAGLLPLIYILAFQKEKKG